MVKIEETYSLRLWQEQTTVNFLYPPSIRSCRLPKDKEYNMATALNRIRHVAFRSVAGVRPIRPSCPLRSAQSFSTTTFYRDEASQTPSSQSTFASTLIAEDRAEYDSLSPNERQEYEKIYRKLDAHMNSPDVQSRINAELSEAAQEVESAELPDDDFDIPKIRPGFMALGEAEEQETGEDEEFDGDDITSMGHSHLEQHREIRHYARIAAWEMPLLSSTFITPEIMP